MLTLILSFGSDFLMSLACGTASRSLPGMAIISVGLLEPARFIGPPITFDGRGMLGLRIVRSVKSLQRTFCRILGVPSVICRRRVYHRCLGSYDSITGAPRPQFWRLRRPGVREAGGYRH